MPRSQPAKPGHVVLVVDRLAERHGIRVNRKDSKALVGVGEIDGRPVMVGAEDFTVAGGSIGTAAASKRTRAAQLALRNRTPLVMMLEGAGHRATNALERNRPAPNDLQAMADLSGLVPTVAIVTGPSAGHGALAAPLPDFVIMVGGHGALFTVRLRRGEQSLGADRTPWTA